MIISLIIPSRGRPEKFRQAVDSAFATAVSPELVEVVCRLDEDDSEEYQEAQQVTFIRGPRLKIMSDLWNECLPHAKGEIFQQADDDLVYQTQGWDERVRTEFLKVPDRIVLVHGNNGFHGPNLACNGFFHRRWVDALGYLAPPRFGCDWGDTWLHELAELLGRRVYMPDVLIQHFHWMYGNAEMDETYQFRQDMRTTGEDRALYQGTGLDRLDDAEKLHRLLGVPL